MCGGFQRLNRWSNIPADWNLTQVWIVWGVDKCKFVPASRCQWSVVNARSSNDVHWWNILVTEDAQCWSPGSWKQLKNRRRLRRLAAKLVASRPKQGRSFCRDHLAQRRGRVRCFRNCEILTDITMVDQSNKGGMGRKRLWEKRRWIAGRFNLGFRILLDTW